jgi:hypothetical protein
MPKIDTADLAMSSTETLCAVARPRQRHKGSERKQLARTIADRYTQGASIRAIVAETGLSFGKVRGLLLEHGITLRTRGGNHGRRSV